VSGRTPQRRRQSEYHDRPVRPFGNEEQAARRSEDDANQEEEEEKLEDKSDSEDHEGPPVKEKVEEGQVPKQLVNTKGPTKKEREEHELTHIPYRSWCEHCVKGRGRKTAHKRQVVEDKKESLEQVTKIYIDFYFNGKDEEGNEGEDDEDGENKDSPAMVMYDARTRAVASWVLDSKSVTEGGANDWVPAIMTQEIESWGYGHRKIILSSDGEPSILVIKDKITKLRQGETVPEETPVGEHQANLAENAVKRVREQTRTILGSLEEKCGERIDRSSPAMQWMVRWASALISRYQLGDDGKTAYERIRGRKCKGPIAKFAERVLFKESEDGRRRRPKNERPKIETSWRDGIWLGIKNRTGEHIIGTPEGVVKAYTVRRRPEEERWSAEEVNAVRGTPGRPKPGRRDMRIPVRVQETMETIPERTQGEAVRTRRVYLKKKDFIKPGYTPGCEGCVRIRDNRERRAHTSACIERMKEELMKTEEGKERLRKAEERINEDIGRAIENDEKMEDVVGEEDEEDPDDRAEREGQGARGSNEDVQMSRMKPGAGVASGELMKIVERRRPDGGIDLVEMYSPERIATVAREKGLRAGLSMDLLTGWNFDREQDREEARRYVRRVKPMVVVGSPMCTAFSQLQNLNWGKSEERDEKMREALKKACRHMEFMMEIYQIQIDGGRYFLHEHPATASSWRLKKVIEIQSQDEVMTVVGDQCELGLVTRDKFGQGAAKKPTKFMTNSIHIAQELAVKCKNSEREPGERHRHIPLMNGRAAKAQEYPRKMCEAVVRGIEKQKEADRWGTTKIMTLKTDKVNRMERDVKVFLKKLAEEMGESEEVVKKVGDMIEATVKDEVEEWKRVRQPRPEEEEDSNQWVAFDDVSGAALDPKLVREARRVEMEYFQKMKVYSKVPRRSLPRGAKVIKVKWIDINKGDEERPDMRSRLVAMEFRDGDRPELFAGTPPSEALRMLISIAATERKDTKKNAMMVNDVRRAYFYARVRSKIYVELPDEDKTEKDKAADNVGVLNLSMYGTREAATNWQREVADHLESIGFTRGSASSCIYHHQEREISTLVHGDDYASTAAREDLEWLEEELKKKFEIKTTIVGHDKKDDKEMKVLNRVIRATDEGWEYEGDQRHGEIIVRETGMGSAKGVTTAGEDDKAKEEEKVALDDEKRRWYRGVTARANYYSIDRPDISFATKEACRTMSTPTVRDEKKMKRMGRYLRESPRVVQKFQWQKMGDATMRVYTDSDWAGCDRTRKSTSGGVIFRGQHCLKFWSKTQQTVAMSSGEAELMAMVKGCCEGIGAQAFLHDAGLPRGQLEVHADASAALGIAHREGIGRIRHLDVAMLWIQQKQWKKRITVNKVNGKDNPADMFTKNVPRELCDKFLTELGFERRIGRAAASAQLVANQ